MSTAADRFLKTLVLKAQKGDAEAFGQIYELLLDDLFRYVYFKVRSEDAGDLCEDVFLKAWESLASYTFQPGASFRSWIFKIAHNLVIDYYRKNKETVSLEEGVVLEIASTHATPEQEANVTLTLEHLQQALQTLKEESQQVIIWKFINDLSYAEMSDITGKTEGALRIVVHRALQELREVLDRMGHP